jgi:hypothetical protein
MKVIKIRITSILDAWNADVDIEDYSITENNALRVVYYDGDDRTEDTIPADELAEWFDARFVRWDGDKNNPDSLVVTRNNGENN